MTGTYWLEREQQRADLGTVAIKSLDEQSIVLLKWEKETDSAKRGMDQIFKDLGYHPENCGHHSKMLGDS